MYMPRCGATADSQLRGKLCCSKEGTSQFLPAACSLFRLQSVVGCMLWTIFAMTIFAMLVQYCSCDLLSCPGREINFCTGHTLPINLQRWQVGNRASQSTQPPAAWHHR